MSLKFNSKIDLKTESVHKQEEESLSDVFIIFEKTSPHISFSKYAAMKFNLTQLKFY